MTRLLGGTESPIGWAVQFIDAPPGTVLEALRSIHSDYSLEIEGPESYPAVLQRLAPFEAPWTRELVLSCGTWTAYMNNFVNGGDSSAVGPAVAHELGVRCVIAVNAPRYGLGHQATQLEVMGPAGTPPLMYERTLSASATDGRWEWHEWGAAFPFEDTVRYQARRIRDRFDRGLLIVYLAELGIDADNDDAYGEGVILQQKVPWKRRTVSLGDARRDLA